MCSIQSLHLPRMNTDADIHTEDHPSVRHSHSAGAIGVMAVKKSKYGLWLHFAHNTDSFVCSLLREATIGDSFY